MSLLSLLMLALFSLGGVSQTDVSSSQAVRITINPQQPYIERIKSEQSLSFDFLLENTGEDTLRISKIRLSVFDAKDKLVLQKFANTGIAPTLKTATEIEGKKTLLLLNPFYSFDAAVELKKLRYEFFLTDARTGEKEYKAEITVTPAYYEVKTDLILPLKGRVLVYSGHDFYAHHRRVDTTNPIVIQLGVKTNPTRYSYDFSAVNQNGDLYRRQGETNEDWFGFGMPLYAPGSGVVTEMTNDVPDNILGKKMFDFNLVFKNIKSFYGNYVAIDHLNGEYSLLLHLKQGSVKVKVGDRIKQGQPVAEMGISGDSEYVHLHYQLQNGLQLNNEPLPSYFSNFRWLLGSNVREIKRGAMNSGDIVESR